MPLSTIFQLCRGSQFYRWSKPTRVSRENRRPAASHRQTLSHNIVSTMHWITNQNFFPEAVKSVYLCIIFFNFVDLQKVDNI